MIRYSVIIPVYNRPEEIHELLQSLTAIQRQDWEILVVDDGSEVACKEEVIQFKDSLPVRYFEKENTGQGFTRNWASEKAGGEFLVFFDSDCLIPKDYFQNADRFIKERQPDAWGGPDKAHASFTDFQKAVAFTMSSFLTTGGIRGKKGHIGKFQPRSFNMGIKKEVFESVKGFRQTNLGEDIELSTRLLNEGFKTELFEDCFVYHKRRETLDKFISQAYSFGKGRVINSRQNRGAFKLVHLLPVLFTLGFISIPFWSWWQPYITVGLFISYVFYFFLVGISALAEYRSAVVGLMSIPVSFIQLASYGAGIVKEWVFRSRR